MVLANTDQAAKGHDSNAHAARTALTPNDNGTINLPEGIEVSALDLAREGQNLVMTGPDGAVYVVEGYFSAAEAPVLMSDSGAMLSPALVQSFLKTPGDVQVAANEQASDKSPVGQVTEASGEATVTHADGTKEKIAAGTEIYEGDIVETDAKGAVNIKFVDDSTFAVSENARLAVDDFSFNAADQSGTTGLSILRGVFMFTSGLVGRENPDAVHLNTPVGSIGIRGTIVGGHINENGQSQISVLEGAIVVRNGAGEQILSDQFETVRLTGFNAPINNIGTLDATTITSNYGAVSGVSPTLFTSINDAGSDANRNQQQQGQQPNGENQGQQQEQRGEGTDNQPRNGAPEGQQGQQPPADGAPQGPNAGNGPNSPNGPNGQPQNAQGDGTQPPQPLAPPSALDNRVLFQVINSGSNIDGPIGAPPQNNFSNPNPPIAPIHLGPPAPPPPPPLGSTPPPQDRPPVDTTLDTRPPVPLVFQFSNTIELGMNEELPSGTPVGRIVMSQALPFPVTYTLINDPDNVFNVDAAGNVTLKANIGDYDTMVTTFHELTVRVQRTDGGNSQTVDTTLKVNVLPVDEAPHFGAPGSSVAEGGTHILTQAEIGATDPEHDTNLRYTVTGTNKGVVEVYDGSNWNTSSTFTRNDLDNNKVRFSHNGDEPGSGPANITLTATDAGGLGQTSAPRQVPITVSPVNDLPTQVVRSGGSVTEDGVTAINPSKLNYSDSDNPPSQVIYTLGTSLHGTVEKTTDGGTTWTALSSGSQFTQADINADKMRFHHNGDEQIGASFNFSVSDGTTPITGLSLSFGVNPVNDAPQGSSSTGGNVTEGQALDFTPALLEFTDVDNLNTELTYTIVDTLHGHMERYNGSVWTGLSDAQTFTQQEINDGKIRFAHNGDEQTTATLHYTLGDGTVTTNTQTLSLGVTNVNDAATAVGIDPTKTFGERTSAAVSEIDLGPVAITDGELVASNPDYSFVVQRYNGSGYVTDSRFFVTDDAGVWKLKAHDHTAFDHETEGTITLRVELTDGTHGAITSADMTITVGDVNEAATSFTVNDNMMLDGTYTSAITGKSAGSYIAVLRSEDPDSNPSFKPTAANYRIIDFVPGSSGLVATDLEIVDVTRGGHTEQVVKLKDNVTGDFAGLQSVSFKVELDAAMNGFTGGDDIQTANMYFAARNDMLILEAVNGKTGFQINNDARFGGVHLGASLAVGDINGDGRNDLIFGAPQALNGETPNEVSGGVYAMNTTSGFFVAAGQGEVLLSDMTSSGSSTTGFFKEPITAGAGNDANRLYGASVASLKNFDGTGGADIAVTDILGGKVEVLRNGNTGNITSIINISESTTSAVPTPELPNAIKIASIGDVNGDGLTDLLISTPYNDTGNDNSGKAYVVFGSKTIGTTIDIQSLGSAGFQVPSSIGSANTYFGSSVTGLGDFNGDGYADFAVGSQGADTDGGGAGFSQGRVEVFFGKSTPISSDYMSSGNKLTINGVTNGQSLGTAIAGAGDFNHDGKNDLLIRDDGAVSGNGALYIIYGNPSLQAQTVDIGNFGTPSVHQGFKVQYASTHQTGITIGDTFGRAGDFNGDGYDDIFVDVRKDLGSGKFDHTLVVLYGDPTSGTVFLNTAMNDPSKTFKIHMLEDDYEHITATAAGDLNGDGFQDILIGTPTATHEGSANEDGGAYVVYGGNYDGEATSFSGGTQNASINGQAYDGSTTTDGVFNNGMAGVNFRGGDGNDFFVLNVDAGIGLFDGGRGSDTLKLFYSNGETGGTTDTISLTDLRFKATGVERLEFVAGSKMDTVQLDIKDIISMASSSENHQLVIMAAEDLNGTPSLRNNLQIFNGGGQVFDLSTMGFTKDVDSNGVDKQNLWGANDAFVYTHTQTGVQLVVDARLVDAGNLSTT